ncbi:MAG: methyltransferase domain-containing protein [Nitrosarchaeum sp.]|nr:methyltransferase domain-containing protein [Nitrosarchaeum sp.]
MEKTVKRFGEFDIICSIHVINYTGNPKKAIRVMSKALRTGGLLIIADIGRVLSVRRHGIEIFQALRKKHGLFGSLWRIKDFKEVIRQNRRFRTDQLRGVYPLHNLKEVENWVESTGLKVIKAHSRLYLGDDDYVVAVKH